MNPDAEIMRLRSYLSQKGWMSSEIDSICDLASNDINEIILDIVSNAVAEATDYAAELGAEEFVEELDVVEVGNGFMITTRSGKTDFSTPEIKMLPHLLKGAPEGENGRYRVVPVAGKSNRAKTPTRPTIDIFSSLRQRDAMLQEARANLISNSLDKRSARAQQMASDWRNILQRKIKERVDAVKQNRPAAETTREPEFRTASEQQDPETQWVIPARDMDMTGFLMDMNKRIQESIEGAVSYIISSYEREFA